VAFESIAELVREHPRPGGAVDECGRHAGAAAWAACSRCGKGLCRECAPVRRGPAFCGECRSGLGAALSRLRVRSPGPAAVTVLMLVVLSLYYGVRGGGEVAQVEAAEAAAIDPDVLDYHNWLYLLKGARQRFYADFLKRERRHGYVERYLKAARALGRVLEGLEARHGFSLEQKPGRRLKKAVRRQVGSVLLAQARCYRCTYYDKGLAMPALEKAIEIDAGPEVAGQAMFLLGIACEELGDLAAALEYYREAQRQGEVDIFDAMLDLMEGPLTKRRFRFLFKGLAGSYRPVEAQERLIDLLREMGRDEEAEKEVDVLLERYPFSERAKEERKRRGEPERRIEDILKTGDAEETFRVIPLEE
jgi:tetratricopeptide (TPR) repeat protein